MTFRFIDLRIGAILLFNSFLEQRRPRLEKTILKLFFQIVLINNNNKWNKRDKNMKIIDMEKKFKK